MATTSTSALFTRSGVLSNASRTPKRRLAASADSRRLVDSAVISKSSGSDFNAGMCACAAHPRSGLAPMMPTRILPDPLFIDVLLHRYAHANGYGSWHETAYCRRRLSCGSEGPETQGSGSKP